MTVYELMELLQHADPDAIVGFAHTTSDFDFGSATEVSSTVIAGHTLARGHKHRPAVVLVSSGSYLDHGFAPEPEDDSVPA